MSSEGADRQSGGEKLLAGLEDSHSTESEGHSSDSALSTKILKTINGRGSPFLLREQNTGNVETLDAKGRKKPIEAPTSNFSHELVENFSSSLKKELTRLMDLEETDPAAFNRFMNEPFFRPYRDLYHKYVKTKEGSGSIGGHQQREFDDNSFEEYMNTDAGFQTAVEMRMLNLESMAINTSEFIYMNLGYDAPDVIRDQDAETGKGGLLRRGARRASLKARERLMNHGRRRPIMGVQTKGGAAALVSYYSALGGIAGTVFGPLGTALGIAVSPAAAGIAYSFRPGERIELDRSWEAQYIAETSSPVMREWALKMNRVDSSNFMITNPVYDNNGALVGGDVQMRNAILDNRDIATQTKHPDTVRDELFAETEWIRKAQEAMGLQRQARTGGMDIMGLRSDRQQFIQHDYIFENEANDEFLQTLVDLNGNAARIEVAEGRWEPNPDFDWQNTDRFAAHQLRREIRSRRLSEKINRDFNTIAEWDRNHRLEFRERIEKRGALYGKEGKLATRRKEAINREIGENGRLKTDATVLGQIEERFTAFQTSISGLQEHQRQREQIGNRVEEVIGTPAQNPIAVIAEVLSDVPAGTTQADAPLPIYVDGVQIQSLGYRKQRLEELIQQRVENTFRANYGNEPNPPGQGAGAKAQEAYQKFFQDRAAAENTYRTSLIAEGGEFYERAQEIRSDETLLRQVRDEIRNKDAEIRTATQILARRDDSNEVRRNTIAVLGELNTALTTIDGWSMPGVPGINLTRAELATQPQDVLIQRIHEVNQLDPTVGWPEAADGQERYRQMLVRARVEARVTTTNADFETAINPTLWGLTEYDLFILSNDAAALTQLFNEIRANPPAGITPPANNPDVDNVRTAVRERFRQRQEAMEALTQENQGEQARLENELTILNERGIESTRLQVINKAVERLGPMNTEIMKLTTAQLIESLSVDPAATLADRYSAAEQAFPIAYVNIMQWMFDHQNDFDVRFGAAPRGPDAAFARNGTVLSQEDLRRLLVENFDLNPLPAGVAGPVIPPATFERAVELLGAGLRTGRFTKTQVAEFLSENVIYGFMSPMVAAA